MGPLLNLACRCTWCWRLCCICCFVLADWVGSGGGVGGPGTRSGCRWKMPSSTCTTTANPACRERSRVLPVPCRSAATRRPSLAQSISSSDRWWPPAASALSLTEEGRLYALQVIRTHRLWEHYLAHETGVAEREWHARADRVEHQLSPAEVDALSARLGHPVFDPHGDPIPTASGEVRGLEGQPLNTMAAGQSGARGAHRGRAGIDVPGIAGGAPGTGHDVEHPGVERPRCGTGHGRLDSASCLPGRRQRDGAAAAGRGGRRNFLLRRLSSLAAGNRARCREHLSRLSRRRAATVVGSGAGPGDPRDGGIRQSGRGSRGLPRARRADRFAQSAGGHDSSRVRRRDSNGTVIRR